MMTLEQMAQSNMQLVIQAKDLAVIVKDLAHEFVAHERAMLSRVTVEADPFITIEQAADALHMSTKTVRDLCKKGVLRYERPGHKYQIYRDSIAKVEENKLSNPIL